MSLGTFVYQTFFKPTSWLRYHFHHFGLKGTYAYYHGEAEMKKAAMQLPAIRLVPINKALSINYLTGAKYWHQTIFGIQSLVDQYGTNLFINIYSDGTLTPGLGQILKNYCPQISLITEEQILEGLNTIIPSNKYPSLNFLRTWSPFYKRMIDIHCKPSWNIHLDSDMLFLNYPHELINNSLQKKAFYMEEQSGQSFFSDDGDTLYKKLNIPTLKSVNGGIIAYDGNAVDYDALEYKTKQLLQNYFQKGPGPMEQTLMSYILFTQNGVPLNQNDYKIYYDNKIDDLDNTVLRHYIFKAKLPYFSNEWKKISH